MTIDRPTPRILYRVRHPAAPELFVWMAGTFEPTSRAFVTPLRRVETSMGMFARLTIQFSEMHPGMAEDDARRVAAFVGGTVEEVEL